MKNTLRFLFTITFFAILSWFCYKNQGLIRERVLILTDKFAEYLGTKVVPCEKPIVYTLGTIDKQFKITDKYFLDALRDAEAIWEKPFGKELFTYSANAKGRDVLTVNLVYDLRQEATNKLAGIISTVKDNSASYDALKIQFTSLKAEFTKAKSDYELSKSEEDRIKVNEIVAQINALVPMLNRLVSILNISVDKYNTVGASLGESFEEGVYSSDGNTKKIDIFEFSSREKLVRVLAHELGHALGLDHVADPKAIMYSFNKSNNMTLTSADLTELKTICGVK